MKIQGQTLGIYTDYAVIPRATGNIVFHITAITDFSEFEKLIKMPEPPVRQYPNGLQVKDFEDKSYLKAIEKYSEYRSYWMILKSLAGTPGLEWEMVDSGDPETWKNYETELTNAGFTKTEQLHIAMAIMKVNGLDSEKLDEAREAFLADLLKQAAK